MTDVNNQITPVTDGLVMGMDAEVLQLDNIEALTNQIKQSSGQMSKILDSLEKANQS
jgi:hypothetical protein